MIERNVEHCILMELVIINHLFGDASLEVKPYHWGYQNNHVEDGHFVKVYSLLRVLNEYHQHTDINDQYNQCI